MNLRTITSLILAVTLMAPAAGVFGAEQSGRWPYTGPNTPVLTTAANTAAAIETSLMGPHRSC